MSAKVAVYSRNAVSLSEAPLYYLSRKEADALLGESARNVSPKRHKLTHVQLTQLNRDERPSPCTLTLGDMVSGYWEGARKTQGIRDKVEAWPEIGDNLAVRVRPRA